MTDVTSAKSARRRHHWRRDLIELAALFSAVALADVVANLVVHAPDGPVLLVTAAVALTCTAGFHVWWSQRRSHAPPAEPPAGAPPVRDEQDERDKIPRPETALWRLRTTARDTPGSLAALCTALARNRVDILTLQTHPLADGTVDEFLLRAPGAFEAQQLRHEVAAAGGQDTWIERADVHDLVDTPTRVIGLAIRTALDAAELPLTLRQLLGRCTIHSLPAVTVSGAAAAEKTPVEGALDGTVMRLRDPFGGTITVERPYLPFTPTEFARARALVELDARLGPRTPRNQDLCTLPEGNEITVRRAGPDDAKAARALHDRCSERTLQLRYHGPAGDADRYLAHLLNPRFGRTLVMQTSSGRIIGLGHLLWDGDETEVALLVEDDWQRRGIGSELLGRLVAMAVEAGCDSVYTVTPSANTGMVAAMRGLGLPLDYQIEEGILVMTARLTSPSTRSRLPQEEPSKESREQPYDVRQELPKDSASREDCGPPLPPVR